MIGKMETCSNCGAPKYVGEACDICGFSSQPQPAGRLEEQFQGADTIISVADDTAADLLFEPETLEENTFREPEEDNANIVSEEESILSQATTSSWLWSACSALAETLVLVVLCLVGLPILYAAMGWASIPVVFMAYAFLMIVPHLIIGGGFGDVLISTLRREPFIPQSRSIPFSFLGYFFLGAYPLYRFWLGGRSSA